MTILAVSTGIAILALVGLALGLVIAVAVVALFTRVVLPAREIEAYAGDVLTAVQGIEGNLAGVEELARTRRLATSIPSVARPYLDVAEERLR